MSWNEGINRLFASLSTLQELQLIALSFKHLFHYKPLLFLMNTIRKTKKRTRDDKRINIWSVGRSLVNISNLVLAFQPQQ